jgi:mono/diheme cytochrome c family protein
MRAFLLPVVAIVLGAIGACSSSSSSGTSGPAPPPSDAVPAAPDYPVVTQPAEPQRAGDPIAGYQALVNKAYVPCGIPYSAYSQVFADAPEDMRVPGREGKNVTLPYSYTDFTTKDGVELVGANCLTCHASKLFGKVIVGLGNATGDFTQDAESEKNTSSGVGYLITDPKEKAEWQKWKTRVDTIAPYSTLSTRGPNPADAFTAVLFAHHDPKTLAWSDTPLMEVPPPVELPVDVPPWWRMKKKTSMFYTGAGRGDHARIMMTASVLCTSSVEESRAIDAWFPDVRAYIASIEPPKYPYAIDPAIAAVGKDVFAATCERCHGTYGDSPTYPNRLVSLDEIGTDGLLAMGTSEFAGPMVSWFNASFFGEVARFEAHDAYVAPPLDGIWATAPYLHNGSVPTLAALLDSKSRPTYWLRSFAADEAEFDQAAVGWKVVVSDHGKAGEANAESKKAIYDTTLPGYGNAGHAFGDALSDSDRTALIEYLKTL